MDLILIVQIIVSISLSALVLLQVKGTGFGRVWGGLSTSSTRRGLEGVVFKLTFVLAALFFGISTLSIVI
ncbi:preprotein translocase subunit SecG [Candidatus Microgenomates bacterium]|nr:MAG: preprotein translocase subunit SecG [Candidatus Microgenomates bacterium]